MQVEADGEAIVARFTAGKGQPIGTDDLAAIDAQDESPLMNGAKPASIAIVARRQRNDIVAVLACHRHIARAIDHHRPEPTHEPWRVEEETRGNIFQRQRRMGRRRAGGRMPTRVIGRATIDDEAVGTARHLEGKATGMRLLAHANRRNRSSVHQDHRAARFQPLIAGMAGVRYRSALRVIIGIEGCQLAGMTDAHPVEMRQAAVRMTEEAQHRHHAIDGHDQRLRRVDAAIGIGLAQRQEIGQEVGNHRRVAADMATIGQDLAAEFLFKP
ncbi:MAG: hypothetical protein H6R00_718 [Proteobacteria bacterium]|nr:hypothetical protein [Pseudomonadota bacterium]